MVLMANALVLRVDSHAKNILLINKMYILLWKWL